MTDNKMTNGEKPRRISLPDYTLGEELFSSITHGVGAIFGLVAMILLLVKADLSIEYFAAAFYGLALIVLYSTSCIYHGLKKNAGKRVMRVMDHCMIYFLIIGTYAPLCLVALSGHGGLWYFVANCVIAAVGVTFTAIDLKKFRVLSMICYLFMGWIIIFASTKISAIVGSNGFLFILLGGIAYTVGAIVYGVGSKLKYFHSIWHLFVLAGSILHFVAIYLFVY